MQICILFSEWSLAPQPEQKGKEETDYFPDSEEIEQISFIRKGPLEIKKSSKESIQIGESTLEEIKEPEIEKKSQSNDYELSQELERFDTEEIKTKFPNTEPEQRLLRPKMIDELVKHRPTTRDEFLQMIPNYLRISTLGEENKIFIDSVLEIISEFE